VNDAREEEIWPVLADLFFLDTEAPMSFQWAAQFLNERGYSREEVERALVERVAPVAGANLGYLLYPASGIWIGFATDPLCERIGRWQRRRARLPRWHIWLSDLWCRHMLKQLEWERLLDLLA
jgi:hypothetical protein